MSEPDQCIICLDHLPAPASINGASSDDSVTAALIESDPHDNHDSYLNIVAALDGCEHIIHDACIRSWAQKTNTCPICRTPFHSVRVYNGVDGTTCLPTTLPPPSHSRFVFPCLFFFFLNFNFAEKYGLFPAFTADHVFFSYF